MQMLNVKPLRMILGSSKSWMQAIIVTRNMTAGGYKDTQGQETIHSDYSHRVLHCFRQRYGHNICTGAKQQRASSWWFVFQCKLRICNTTHYASYQACKTVTLHRQNLEAEVCNSSRQAVVVLGLWLKHLGANIILLASRLTRWQQ